MKILKHALPQVYASKWILMTILIMALSSDLLAEDGYRLWLRYDKISDVETLRNYNEQISGIQLKVKSETLSVARQELMNGLKGLLGKTINDNNLVANGTVIAGTPSGNDAIAGLDITSELDKAGKEGFILLSARIDQHECIVIAGNTDIGVLYGVFHFLRMLQTNEEIDQLKQVSNPKTNVRVLNHWDNLDRTVERGYAGFSIWDWHKLPGYINQKYYDYARANASIGINGTVLTNVNANALVLTPQYIEKVKALADIFRPYGIRVYLTARFSAPIEIGGLETADPLNPVVREWWKTKVGEIYEAIPDFGGFLVKANSEGQPGPQNYGRNHAEGANMLAEALEPHNGIVMWRAFVYSNEEPEDRAKQAYNEFKPLDGKFNDNVLIQVKNGPIDFQPREPFHPLFGSMPETPLMMEFQITQEYLGQATHLVYLGSMYKETLASDTYAKGTGSTVAQVVDGALHNHNLSGMAGVANIGTDRNWTGHTFGQANWYAFGRLAWNHQLSEATIADEWVRMTFSNNQKVIEQIKSMMLASHEITVNYMTPLGLHHIMGWNHHYGPAPWIKDKHRADWTSAYYHRADSAGIGFNRTASGSNAVRQYHQPLQDKFNSPETCPEKYLLWFHHLPWDYKVESGRNLWDELCFRYYRGVDSVKWLQEQWMDIQGLIDKERHKRVKMLLNIQEKEAIWWRNACVLYFQKFANRPIPNELQKPEKTLEYYQSLSFPYAPGIKPEW